MNNRDGEGMEDVDDEKDEDPLLLLLLLLWLFSLLKSGEPDLLGGLVAGVETPLSGKYCDRLDDPTSLCSWFMAIARLLGRLQAVLGICSSLKSFYRPS